MLPKPFPLKDVEPVLLERRPDLRGRPILPWHHVAEHMGMEGHEFEALPRDEQIVRVVDAICELEP